MSWTKTSEIWDRWSGARRGWKCTWVPSTRLIFILWLSSAIAQKWRPLIDQFPLLFLLWSLAFLFFLPILNGLGERRKQPQRERDLCGANEWLPNVVAVLKEYDYDNLDDVDWCRSGHQRIHRAIHRRPRMIGGMRTWLSTPASGQLCAHREYALSTDGARRCDGLCFLSPYVLYQYHTDYGWNGAP